MDVQEALKAFGAQRQALDATVDRVAPSLASVGFVLHNFII